jgi:hypothetical protein
MANFTSVGSRYLLNKIAENTLKEEALRKPD